MLRLISTKDGHQCELYNIMEGVTGEKLVNPAHLLRLDELMIRQRMDALICRLPENIVYLTGTLPVHGVSAVFYPVGGPPILLHPDCEDIWVASEKCDLEFFHWGHLGDPLLSKTYQDWFARLHHRFGGQVKNLGIEMSVPVSAPAFNSAENLLPDGKWQMMVAENFTDIRIMDNQNLMSEAISIKDKACVEKIHRVNAIAQKGLKVLAERLEPGLREVEVAAMVEAAIRIDGTGYRGAHLVRGFAHVMSGKDGTYRQSMMTPSRNRIIQYGDLVMIELAVQADGLWSDLTRTYCVGTPTAEQRKMYEAVWNAQQAAINAVRDGIPAKEVDGAARNVLIKAGYGEHFIHGTGHGVGYRYHEATPSLSPDNANLLQAGMITSIEPGIYIRGIGGVRIEDNVLVTHEGCEVLSLPLAGNSLE